MRLPLFQKDDDYLAFERVLGESLPRPDAPQLPAWSLMANHWHLVVRAGAHANLSTWMQWVTMTHAHRRHAHTDTAILDRFLHHAELITMKGRSYRLRNNAANEPTQKATAQNPADGE